MKRALVIQHDHLTAPGHIGDRLVQRGYDLDLLLVVPPHGPPRTDFPDPAAYDLVLPLGAPWSAYDIAGLGSWLLPELALLRRAHDAGTPVLGICFGGQLAAFALGGQVRLAARPEHGFTDIQTTDPGLIEPGPWYQAHHDRFEPPPGAERLAWTDVCPQAFRLGRTLGLQFHPEVTPEIVARWMTPDTRHTVSAAGFDPAEILAQAEKHAEASRDRAYRLLDRLLDHIGVEPAR
ncbi:type 1 glutamine amidotransferase [Actinoallomurus sp. CA-150999]|uniref:type 1 glutamine amidotransferase n=1 Tax=Actinoallomurus sp. CA-150999 TaxID=3239887 RepID=UPI003D9433D6